jgi:hypothetical protein
MLDDHERRIAANERQREETSKLLFGYWEGPVRKPGIAEYVQDARDAADRAAAAAKDGKERSDHNRTLIIGAIATGVVSLAFRIYDSIAAAHVIH